MVHSRNKLLEWSGMHRNFTPPRTARVRRWRRRSGHLGGRRGFFDEARAAHRHLDGLRRVLALEGHLHPVVDLDALGHEGVVVLAAAAVRDMVLAAQLVGARGALQELDAAWDALGVVVDLHLDGAHGLVGHVRQHELLLRPGEHVRTGCDQDEGDYYQVSRHV